MKRYVFLLLSSIVALAFGLRIYKVTEIPPSLTWDEVSIGYNAYSILKTGKDEHGRFLPLDTFVAYGDYKPPLSIYLTVPFVAVFGLNELSVRLPSVLFGTATVFLMYFLLFELLDFVSKNPNKDFLKLRREYLSLITVFVLSVSPWHINLSRAGFEANIALFFVVLGVWFVIKAIKKPYYWVISFIPFVAAIYTFNSARYMVVFLCFGLLFWIQKYHKLNFRYFFMGIILAGIALLPILPHLISKDAWLRFHEVNIFSDVSIVETANERIASAGNSWWAKIIYNRRIGYLRSFAMHFFDHFEPRYLFINGDGNPKFSIQDVGQLYIADIVFVAIGIIALFTNTPSLGWFLIFWMVVSIIPAATARETPHALRTLNCLPVWMIIIGYGMYTILDSIHKWKILGIKIIDQVVRSGMYIILVSFYIFNILYYLHNYYKHYPIEYANEWQYGYKQAIQYMSSISDEYKNIYITDKIGRPYMYTLFYLQYSPDKYIKEKQSYFDAAGFYHVTSFDKYVFPQGGFNLNDKTDSLYIVPSEVSSAGKRVIQSIKLPNGEETLKILSD